MLLQQRELFCVDDRTDVGARIGRIADDQFAHCAGDHDGHRVRYVALNEQHAQRRATLSARAECAADDGVGDLFRQRARVDDHRVLPAGFGDQDADR